MDLGGRSDLMRLVIHSHSFLREICARVWIQIYSYVLYYPLLYN